MKTNIRVSSALLLTWILWSVSAAHAETHALIMSISAYRGGVPRLEGVQHDAESAHSIARSMGVKDQNMRYYKDDELTLEGMRKAFAELDERVAPGDQVFIYYSGHGGRQLVKDPEPRCAESLITVDARAFVDSEIEANLKKLGAKAQKVVALLDACHSGGVTTRAARARSPDFSPKYATPTGSEACERPVNVLTRGLAMQSRSVGTGANNYVYIAAARENEVSLDMPAKGGVATQAWRDCITGAAVDRDGSGGLSAEEIRICAQNRIDSMLKNVQGFRPHNVTITGNSSAVLAFAERSATPAPASSSPRPTPSAARPSPASASAPAPATLPQAYFTLTDVLNSRDDRRVVSLQASKSAFKIGVDNVNFTLTSSHSGYVYLLMVGTDGKAFDMLFPNQIDGANSIEAGQALQLPRASWQIKAAGPQGKNYLLAIVADAPRDFSRIGMQPAGPFSMVSANQTSSKDIQLVSGTSAAASTLECSEAPAKRTLQVQRRCSNSYGAAMATIEETN